MSIDISALVNSKAEEGEWVAVAGDFRIKVKGADSDVYRRSLYENAQARYKRGSLDELTYDQLIDEQIALACACTMDWEGLTERGEPLPFSITAADRLYRMAPAVLKVIMQHWGEQQSFTLPSVSASSPTPATTPSSDGESATAT